MNLLNYTKIYHILTKCGIIKGYGWRLKLKGILSWWVNCIRGFGDMQKPGVIQKFVVVFGFLVMLAAGYMATSMVTSCPAGAASCKCSLCVYSGISSLGGVIGTIGAAIVLPAIATATSLILAYMALAFTAFIEQVVSKWLTVVDNIISWFDTFFYYNLKPAMQQQTRQLNTIDTDQARGWGGFADAVDTNRAHKEIYLQEVKSHREVRPGENVCVAGTITGGMARANNIHRAYSAAAPVERLPRSGNHVSTAAGNGRGADQKERWDDYVARYCETVENGGQAGCATDGSHAGQDIDVTGQVFQKSTIDLTNPDVKKSVDDLLINITEPFVRDPVAPGAVASASGQEAILDGEAYKAKRQAIYDSLYYVVARRAPGSGMDEFLRPMREAAGVNSSDISDNPSKNEIMEVMMSERFRTGTYSISQIDEPENNDREIVIQQAFQVMQLNDNLDLLDRFSLMLAADIGAEVQQARSFGTEIEAAPVR